MAKCDEIRRIRERNHTRRGTALHQEANMRDPRLQLPPPLPLPLGAAPVQEIQTGRDIRAITGAMHASSPTSGNGVHTPAR